MSMLPRILPPPSNAPLAGADAPFLIATDTGELTTAYANAGIVNDSPTTAGKRQLEASSPWSGPTTPSLRKLTHFRAPGMGDPMWSGQCVYDMAGADPSFSYYDDPDVYVKDDGLSDEIRAGIIRQRGREHVDAPTTTRRSRVAAHQDSAPAARFFQGYFNARWSGILAGYGVRGNVTGQINPRPLHMNFNPGQKGSKELHRATQYQPVPPMGSLVGYFGSNEKAL